MKFKVTFKRDNLDGTFTEFIEQHESNVVTSQYSAKKYAQSQASRIKNTSVVKIELLEKVKGTS